MAMLNNQMVEKQENHTTNLTLLLTTPLPHLRLGGSATCVTLSILVSQLLEHLPSPRPFRNIEGSVWSTAICPEGSFLCFSYFCLVGNFRE